MKNLVTCLATFFYVGKFPKAPGTIGTLATIPLWYALAHLHPIWYMVVVFILAMISIFIVELYQKYHQGHDRQEIVIDEVIGYLITMTWVPLTWQSAVIGFVLFRFFDIVKPPPIRQLDQKIPGGLGVMIDDIAAGLFSNIILQLLLTYTMVLGTQIITI